MENPSPGKRDGQIHYHDSKNNKYMYDFETHNFQNSTNRIKELFSDKRFRKGLEKAIRLLGEK